MGVETTSQVALTDAPGTDGAPAHRRGRRRAVLVLLAAAVVALAGALVATLGTRTPAPGAAPSLPRPPHFSLPRLGGGPPLTYPGDTTRHHPVVLLFFASWCTPCQKELPVVARFVRAQQRAGSPVRYIGVDGNDQPGSGLAFARRSGVTFPAAEDQQESVAYQLGLAFLPDTVFISAGGQVRHIVEGPVSVATLRHWVHVLTAS